MIHNLAATTTAFSSNTFLVSGAEPALVDTGANFDVVEQLRDRDADLERVVLTHTHRDHVGNLAAVREAFDVPVYGFDPAVDGIDRQLADEETIQLGDHEYLALHTPGHKDDHLCLYADRPGILFAGDLVFANGGFGRTDLDEGDRQTLIESLDRLLERIDQGLAAMHCGHGPSVTTDPYQHVELAARMARQR